MGIDEIRDNHRDGFARGVRAVRNASAVAAQFGERTMTWEIDYKQKLRTPDEALRFVQSGMRVYIQPGCAEPETLVEALMRRAPSLEDVEVVHMMTMGAAPYVAPEMAGHFRHNAMFIGPNVREAINDGRADYTPINLSEIEGLFESGVMPIHVALLQLSPPDSHGFCSFGVGVDTSLTAAKCARFVVAQINAQMPRTFGDSFIHVNEIDAIVDSTRPLCEMKKPEITDMHKAIAHNVAGLIEDGAVLQTGIGGIPSAVLPFLMDRKDLAVHSELVSDGVIPLIEAGVLTGARKTSTAPNFSGASPAGKPAPAARRSARSPRKTASSPHPVSPQKASPRKFPGCSPAHQLQPPVREMR